MMERMPSGIAADAGVQEMDEMQPEACGATETAIQRTPCHVLA